MTKTILSIAAILIALTGAAFAQTNKAARAKPAKPAPAAQTPDCPRASYKGDPVCIGWDASDDLPTPAAGAVAKTDDKRDIHVNDSVTIRGSTDVKYSDKNHYYLNVPNPSPHSQDVSGGAAVRYKF